MTTLYIRHPARAEPSAPVQFALAGDGGALLQQGAGALGSLGELVAQARRVVLILGACDVSVLRVQVPPLSNARLKAALPSLVEDQVLGDPADCVLVVSPALSDDGARSVAVVQRAWLEPLVKALIAQGARSIAALPAQLCLPLQPGSVAAAIGAAELVVRQSQYEGMGLAMAAEPAAALQTVRVLAGDAPVVLYLPRDRLGEYQAVLAEAEPGIELHADDWAHWIAGSKTTTLDLVPGLGASGAPARDWQRWRWPLRLALLAALVNIAALNYQWMTVKREADTVRLSMQQTFRAAYPNEPMTADLDLQMKRNLAAAKGNSGQPGPDEFAYLAGALGEAVATLGQQPAIAAIDYRERALTVKLKPEAPAAQLAEQLRPALAARKLNLTEPAAATWKISGGQP